MAGIVPPMVAVGWHASHEIEPPDVLLRNAGLAELAGFRAASSSDHFHPWGEQQAASGFAWTWLGAAMHATSLPFAVVTSPVGRYHPAVIAEAAATLDMMFPGGFGVGVGCDEALNEHITCDSYLDGGERNARL